MPVHTRLTAIGACVVSIGLCRPAAAQCPPHSHEASETRVGGEIHVTCRCDSGYARVDDACKPVNQARATLARRHQDALRGVSSSLTALQSELHGEDYARLQKAMAVALPAIGVAIGTKDLRSLSKAGLAALVAITAVANERANEWETCAFHNENARAACRNAENFRRIAESSLKQFDDTFK